MTRDIITLHRMIAQAMDQQAAGVPAAQELIDRLFERLDEKMKERPNG